MHFRLSGTAWRIPRAQLVQVGHGQNAAKNLVYKIMETIFDPMREIGNGHNRCAVKYFCFQEFLHSLPTDLLVRDKKHLK